MGVLGRHNLGRAHDGRALTADYGLTRGGYTRLSGTVHTRIDRIYTPIAFSNINWQKIGPHSTLFTGRGASNHLPVLGTFDIVGYKSAKM
eukprot:scaffold5224_cov31-Tisochrysis_lutea.AAC.1